MLSNYQVGFDMNYIHVRFITVLRKFDALQVCCLSDGYTFTKQCHLTVVSYLSKACQQPFASVSLDETKND